MSSRKLLATATVAVAIATYVGAQSRRGSPKSAGDGGPAVMAQLDGPSSLTVDDEDHLYVYEAFGEAIRKVDLEKGVIATLAKGCSPPVQRPRPSDCFGPLAQIHVDPTGKLLLSEFTYDRVTLLDPSTLRLSVIASYGAEGSDGGDGPATLPRFSGPSCSISDRKGNVFICDSRSYIRRIDNKTRAISQWWAPASAASRGTAVWQRLRKLGIL